MEGASNPPRSAVSGPAVARSLPILGHFAILWKNTTTDVQIKDLLYFYINLTETFKGENVA